MRNGTGGRVVEKIAACGPAVEIDVTGANPRSCGRSQPLSALQTVRAPSLLPQASSGRRLSAAEGPLTPTWGRSEATIPAAFLLAPLHGQRKSGFEGAHNASCMIAAGAGRRPDLSCMLPSTSLISRRIRARCCAYAPVLDFQRTLSNRPASLPPTAHSVAPGWTNSTQ